MKKIKSPSRVALRRETLRVLQSLALVVGGSPQLSVPNGCAPTVRTTCPDCDGAGPK